MITVSYVGSGVLLVATAWLFSAGVLSAWTLAAAWAAVFFLASCGASAAYLTVSEVFPMEIRAMCIALFYAVGTGLGGIIGPVLFSSLASTGRPENVALGYYIGAGFMILGGLAELGLGVEAAQRSLEDVAAPLSAQRTTRGTLQRSAQRSGADDRDGAPRRRTVPGRSYRSPPPADDSARDRELGSILEALRGGPLNPADLGARVGADAWPPGRFAETLRYGLSTGVLIDDGAGAVHARFSD
jgi:hypothetical protein